MSVSTGIIKAELYDVVGMLSLEIGLMVDGNLHVPHSPRQTWIKSCMA